MRSLHLLIGVFAILVGLLRILAVTTFEPDDDAPKPRVDQPDPGPFDRLADGTWGFFR
ncbi:MAG: hypothetical protein HYY06_25300 [Deltaproteobacteria bacterium]|nr:hypothetical protein [Deltaproteobacteria bacterium]